MNLLDILRRASEQSGSKVFMSFNREKKTFRQAYEGVLRFSEGLKKLGIKRGDRVAMLLNNSFEFITAYFATVRLGAEIVPFNTFLSMEEVTYILNDSKAKVFITSTDFSGIIKDLNINQCPALENIVGVDDLPMNHIKFGSIYSDEKSQEPQIDEAAVAVIIYTSGTTGHPKGAMLSHRNLISNVEASVNRIKVLKKDRFILFLPMFHVFSFTVCVLIPVYCQCFVKVIKSIQPFSNIIKSLLFDRITVFVAIPQVYNVLSAKKIPKVFIWLVPIRICVSGAAPLAGEVLKRFEEKFGYPLLEGYGLSETSPVVSVNPLDGVRKAGSVGPPVMGVEVRIIGEDGAEVKTGEPGEIAVKGPNVMKGYFNKPQETAEVLKDGWLLTGDIGRLDTDGYLYIVDRKKDLIIVNGMNLYPREVEEVLYRHPAVQDAAVVGKKDITHGEIPIGVIKIRESMEVTDQELRKFCRPHLANFKIPHKFEFWPEVPRTGNGKVLKREIKRIINEKK